MPIAGNKDTRTMSLSVSIVDFEEINVCWATYRTSI